MSYLLVLYHSRTDSVRNMAFSIAEAAQNQHIDVKIRCFEKNAESDIVVTLDDLANCAALAFGCPTRFGMMAANAKAFWDSTSELWLKGSLIDKPAAVFTASASMHGGNEATLLTMALPLLHHGMLLTGIPYDVPALNQTNSGGSPYGATHVSGLNNSSELTVHEAQLCRSVGERLATLIQKLS